jgi:radical SAM-linked protein
VDSVETTTPPAPHSCDRVRLRFRKGGALRLLSHHDLMRCFERLLRRSGLPFHNTQGFHPHPRLVFALSLPLGVVGCEEIADLELDEVLPEEEILARLRRHAPPGLDLLGVKRVPLRSSAQVRALVYRLPLPADRVEAVRGKIPALLAATELWQVRHKGQAGDTPLSRPRDGVGPRVDLRPFLRDLRVSGPDPEGNLALEMDCWFTPAGTAKPVEVLGLLGLTDLLESGAVLERARLELHEEPNEHDERPA